MLARHVVPAGVGVGQQRARCSSCPSSRGRWSRDAIASSSTVGRWRRADVAGDLRSRLPRLAVWRRGRLRLVLVDAHQVPARGGGAGLLRWLLPRRPRSSLAFALPRGGQIRVFFEEGDAAFGGGGSAWAAVDARRVSRPWRVRVSRPSGDLECCGGRWRAAVWRVMGVLLLTRRSRRRRVGVRGFPRVDDRVRRARSGHVDVVLSPRADGARGDTECGDAGGDPCTLRDLCCRFGRECVSRYALCVSRYAFA